MGLFLALIGPSGAGKSTVAEILERDYDFFFARDVTTRQARDDHDTSHVFVDETTFMAMKARDEFIGTFDAFGAHYGLPKFQTDKPVVVLVRAPVVPQLKAMIPSSRIIQLEAPLATLTERLEKRHDTERLQESLLQKEIEAGHTMSDVVLDSSIMTPEQLAQAIVRYTTAQQSGGDHR
jgi:guanylate kinase